MDDRIQQSKDYVKYHKDRRSGVEQSYLQEIRDKQKDWREQVENLVNAEIKREARKL